MKKRILSILLVVCMVVSLLPCFAITAMAAGAVTLLVNTSAADDSAARGTGAKYKTLAGAVAKAVSGDTIKLETDCVVSATIGIEGVTLVLDLNDKSITCDVDNSYYTNYIFNVGNGGTLTVTDMANGLGKIQYPSPIAVTSNGTVTVAGGTIKAISGGYGPVIHCNNSAGTVNVTGGTVIADNGGSEGYGAINGGGTVNISGGTVVGTGDTPAIKTVGIVNVSGGYINSLSSLSKSIINVTGGNIGLFRIFTGGTAYVTGGTINRINHDGTLQNRNSQSLRLYVLTGGDPNTAVSSFSVTPALGYTYGINDVKTDGEGKIYVWMPEGITNVSVTAGGKTMTIDLRIRGEEITNCSPGLTLPSPGAYGQMFDFYGTGYSGRVTWSPSATPFLPGKVYTGTFILTAVESYTFTGMTGAFTVSGATSVTASDNTGTTLKLTAVFPETPSPQNVTVAVKKDGAAWTGHGKSFALYQDGSSIYSLNSSGSNASVYPGTYDIYEGTTDTGVDITVSKGGANSATVNYYTVTFKSQDGNTPLNTQTVLAGQDAVYGGTAPNKTADAQYTYTFSKWVTTINGSDEAVFNNITSTNTVFACFVPTLRSYTITWKKDSSTTIDTTTVDYGLIPSHVAPTKTGCSFEDWEPAIGSVTGDAVYTATWAADPYSISYALNGGTVSIANPNNYTIESTDITLNNPSRSGYSFIGWSGTDLTGTEHQTVTIPAGSTGAKSYTANWKADTPSAPQASVVTARTDTSITIAVENGYEYSLDGTNWHSGTGSYTFTGLIAAQSYSLVCRKAEVNDLGSASAASDTSTALSVTTKNAAPAAPLLTFDSITANSVTISAVTGGEYSKDGGSTWQNSNLFTGLSAATKYNFAVRIKETADTEASATVTVDQYTAAAAPASGEGYTINFNAETISISSGYEVSADSDFATTLTSSAPITPGAVYYVRKAVDTTTTPDTPASESISFTVSARPAAPTSTAYSYDYKGEQIIFDSQYEVFTAASGGSAVTSDVTAITPGSMLYIRVKSTDSAPASGWTTINVPERQATAGLVINTNRTDKTITVNAVTGAEYSKDGGITWQSDNEFTGLSADKNYSITIRYAAAASSFASNALISVPVKTKSSAGAAPSGPTVSAQSDNAIIVNTVAGCQYAVTTSSTAPTTWGAAETSTGTKTFSSLSAATKYYIWVRVAETDAAMPSNPGNISAYTAAAAPASGEGYTINFNAETISISSGYEVSTDSDFATTLTSGAPITPGAVYYVRKAADTTTTPDTPASESISFTVSARPAAPTSTAYSYDYKGEQIIFDSQYEVFTAASGGSAVTSDVTAITPGSMLYIRVKSTDSAPASSWTTINVPERQGTAGLSIYAISSDTTIAVTEIAGAEYSKDGGTTWQSGNQFTGLDANKDYNITIRYAADSTFASEELPSVTVRTKTSAADAPSVPSVISQTDHAISIDTVAGCQYTITTSSTAPTTWGAAETSTGTKTFSSLSAATKYYIWVRVAETDAAMPSGSSRISVYTASSVPSAEGYTIDYSAETISYDGSIYEITADTAVLPLKIIGSGDSITDNISDYGAAEQKIYVRVKAVTDGAPAGAWMQVPLPARPETPAAAGFNETVESKNDGRITGVTEAMEWKDAGGAYTAVTAEQESNGIIGLSDGTYYVRYMAVSSIGFKSDEQEITIAAGHTITVTFNAQGGSEVASITGKAYGDSIAAPAPTRGGFYLAGWYKEPSCTNVWTFAQDKLADNIALFAKWSAIPTYTVTGRIVDDVNIPVEGAAVKIMKGVTQFGTAGVTDPYGDFTIDNVPPGIYNLVISKGTKTAIIKVEVSSGNVAIGNAALPSGNANSILVVTGSDTPNVVVGGLDREAGTQLKDFSKPTDKVEIKLTVEEKNTSTAANGSEVVGAAAAEGKQVGMILAIDVSKTVNGTEETSYRQTNGLIEIIIPLPAELQGKATYGIYRYHGTGVDVITETPNDDREQIVIDRTNWTIMLHAKKFSTYAIGYTNPHSRDWGDHNTAAVIPREATAALPYYVENGKVIFIGFASDANGTMKYIAPAGVTVLLRENPKSFNDIAGHWAKENINFVTERELFLGTGDGNFAPESGMTRAMFAAVIGRLYERSYGKLATTGTGSRFSDADYTAYYGNYVGWAVENNIVTGVGNGKFEPDRKVTRQEMAVMLYRFSEFLKISTTESGASRLSYTDAAEIPTWAVKAAVYCQETGIITGRSGGNFVPQGTATRAEVAAILQRFIESSVK